MFSGMHFDSPFAQIKKRGQGKQRKKHIWQNFGNQNQNQGFGNNGWGQNNDNGWGQNNNDNGLGINNNNGGWGQTNDNGWGNNQNDNGLGNNNNINGWGYNGMGNQGYNNYTHDPNQFGNGFQWVNDQQSRHQSNFLNIGFGDIGGYIQQQVVYIQPSPAKKQLQELKKNGQTFKDTKFPPNQSSLTGQLGYVAEWKEIKWTPISQGIPNAKIITGKIEPADISQGYLGDCYFLAALAALAQRPDRIFNLFLLNQTNQQKYYSVKMLYKGKWITIDMDEHIPFLYNKPAFTKSRQNQLWVVLLEKAWAKMYTSYKRIEAGYPEEGLHDLTGAPIKQITFKSANFDKERQWAYMLKASQLQYSMVTSSQPGSDTNKSVSGVVQGHAYTLLNATQINLNNGQRARIVQLRNPWGKGQAKGRWSDNDASWNMVSPAEKQRVGFNPNVDDGIFFMDFDQYCQQFRALTIAEVDDNASYIYKSHKDQQQRGCYFKVIIHKNGNYCLNVDKTPERSFDEKTQQSYQYPNAQLEIGKLQGASITGKTRTNSSKRTLFHDIDLTQGTYICYVKISFNPQFEKDFDVNLAVYAQFPCEVQLANQNEANSFAGRNTEWTGEQQQIQKEWNSLSSIHPSQNQGNGGWGNQPSNDEWGNNQPQNNNSGWENNGNYQQNSNDGWGNNQQNLNTEWGNNQPTVNDGWGNSVGSNNPMGYGNQQNNNDGWGNQPNNNNGW